MLNEHLKEKVDVRQKDFSHTTYQWGGKWEAVSILPYIDSV